VNFSVGLKFYIIYSF